MHSKNRKKIIIVGGGPSGMMAAIQLSKHHDVCLYEKGKTLGKKFLVAGKGGFNLSNNLNGRDLRSQYTPENIFDPILKNFDSKQTRKWLQGLGIETFIGSSGRIFPIKGIKPIAVLKALKNRILEDKGVIYLEHEMIDFDSNQVVFKHLNNISTKKYDACIFALGGGSWSITGSNGNWLSLMKKNNILTRPFEASNCGLEIDFSKTNINQFIGEPLKNISISFSGITVKGEAIITSYGLEGNAIYPMVQYIREKLKAQEPVVIAMDFKPFNSEQQLLQKLLPTTKPKNYKYIYNLNNTQQSIIKGFTNKKEYLNPESFDKSLKNITLPITGLRPIEEAISTVGGIKIEELNRNLSLKKIPNIYIAGEMFDWDTITGGFLLQGCFATGYHISKSILESQPEDS